jgi:hypothetical protein
MLRNLSKQLQLSNTLLTLTRNSSYFTTTARPTRAAFAHPTTLPYFTTYRTFTMSAPDASLHKDPVTGEMISKS